MENNTLTPAERVALLIKKLDVTTYQFGKATGISHQTLSNVLTGKNKPGLDTLQAIASVYPAAAVFLLTGAGEPFPNGVRGTLPANEPEAATSKDTEKPEAAAVPVISAVPSDYGTTVEIAINRARLADKDILIEQQRVEIARLNRELGKPFNGLDAAGPEPTPTPRNPIGFALSVSRRVKMNGAARPL